MKIRGKVAIFAFNGDLICFAHVMLNALEMREKDYDVKMIIEGSAKKQGLPLCTMG